MATIREDDNDDNSRQDQEAHVEVENEAAAHEEPDVEVVEGADERLNEGNESHEGGERRPRETAAERRERAKKAKDRDKRELEFQRREMARLDAELAEMKRTTTVNRVTELDSRIATELNTATTMDDIRAKAITKAQGGDAVAAERLANEARQKAAMLDQEKRQLIHQANQPKVAEVPYLDKARDFISANPWYNANGDDEDSRQVREIDNAVAKEYIPTSDAYWKELQRRVKLNLPHRATRQESTEEADEVEEPRTQRRGPPVGGSTRSNSSTANATQIRLSPERVSALKEAGLWDDPKVRMRMAKTYAQYDKDQRG